MSESKNELKARAVDLLRRANWTETAGDFEIGALTAADTLRRLRSQWAPDRGEREAIAALEAYINAEWPAVTAAQPAPCKPCAFDHTAAITCSACAPTELARAIAALAEARARCDELREQIAESEQARRASDVERDRTQSTLDEALAIQSQIWDAIGGQREGESLVDAVRRVVGDTKEASVSNQNDAGQRRTGFDAGAQWVSRARTEQTSLADVGDGATIAAEAAWRRQLDEAREAGRAEAKAEIERLRAVVFEFQRATGVLRPEWAKMRLESYESCDTDSLRHECRGCGRPISWEGACSSGACGSAAPPYPYGRGGKNDPLSVVANAPTVSASEGPGEAGPGCGGTETAGAEESVALREEVARLRRELESVVTAHAAESEAWVKATGASSPDEAEADANRDGETWEKQRVEIAFLRDVLAKRVAEIDSLHHQLSTAKTARDKARSERSRSDDALKAIEEALLSAGITPQSDESLVDTARRALENRDVRATKVERVPQVGDMVNLRVSKGVHPCVVLHVWNDGSVNLRDLFDLDEVESRPRDDSGERLGTWRFRD